MILTICPGGMTARIAGSRGEMIGLITDMGPTRSLLLIRINRMPATASVRRAVVLLGAKTKVERTMGRWKEALGGQAEVHL